MPDFDLAAYEIGLARARGLDMASSATLPDLPNKKNKTNWVEKAGGLPSYIDRIAKHLHSEKGMDVSRAIATAVNTVKKWCAGGDDVKADTKAKACAAVAEWEAKKGKSKANLSVGPLPGEAERLVVYHGVFLSQQDAEYIDSLVAPLADSSSFDPDAYQRALDLAVGGVIQFDPAKHPRDLQGHFRGVVGGLKPGQRVQLPDGAYVEKKGNYLSYGGKGSNKRSGDIPLAGLDDKKVAEAADGALANSASNRTKDSLGGAKNYSTYHKRQDQLAPGEKHTDGLAEALKAHEAKHAPGASLADLKKGDVVTDAKHPALEYKVVGTEEFQGQKGTKVKSLLDGKTSIIWHGEGDNDTRWKKKSA